MTLQHAAVYKPKRTLVFLSDALNIYCHPYRCAATSVYEFLSYRFIITQFMQYTTSFLTLILFQHSV